MNKLNRLLAALLCAALLLTAAACGAKTDSSWIAKNAVASYTPGLYRIFQLHGITNITSSLGVDFSAALTQKVSADGMTGSEYTSVYADGELSWVAAVDAAFEEYGLSLSEEDNAQIDSYVNEEIGDSTAYYDALGVTRDDMVHYFSTGYKANLIFRALYATEGGEFYVPDDEVRALMTKTYDRINYIYLSKNDLTTGERLSDTEIAAQREKAADYLARYQAGEAFADLYYENYREFDSTATRLEDYRYDVYLAKEDDGALPPEFYTAVAALKEGEAQLIEGDSYCAVVLKKALNTETPDEGWTQTATSLLYATYQDKFNDWISDRVDNDATLQINEDAKALYTPESLVKAAKKYYLDAANTTSSSSGSSAGESSSELSESSSQSSESAAG